MIIDSTSSTALNLVPTAPARTHKAHAHKKTGATESAPDETAATQTELTAQNIASTVSPVSDANAARVLIQNLKQNFLQNPGSAMLAQANPVPENALRLLQ